MTLKRHALDFLWKTSSASLLIVFIFKESTLVESTRLIATCVHSTVLTKITLATAIHNPHGAAQSLAAPPRIINEAQFKKKSTSGKHGAGNATSAAASLQASRA